MRYFEWVANGTIRNAWIEGNQMVKADRDRYGDSNADHIQVRVYNRTFELKRFEHDQLAEANPLTPLLIGLGAAVVIVVGRKVSKSFSVWKNQPRTSIIGNNFYEGGFEKTMTKREASRILGIRQTADAKLVLERYRTLVKLNHPDRGGSPLLAKKINEAKELMMKGKDSKK